MALAIYEVSPMTRGRLEYCMKERLTWREDHHVSLLICATCGQAFRDGDVIVKPTRVGNKSSRHLDCAVAKGFLIPELHDFFLKRAAAFWARVDGEEGRA